MIRVEVGEEVGYGETGIAAEGVYEETGVGDEFGRGIGGGGGGGGNGGRKREGRWWW